MIEARVHAAGRLDSVRLWPARQPQPCTEDATTRSNAGGFPARPSPHAPRVRRSRCPRAPTLICQTRPSRNWLVICQQSSKSSARAPGATGRARGGGPGARGRGRAGAAAGARPAPPRGGGRGLTPSALRAQGLFCIKCSIAYRRVSAHLHARALPHLRDAQLTRRTPRSKI